MSWTGEENKTSEFACHGNSVEYVGPEPTQSTIFNAMYSQETKVGENYYEFKIENGEGISVGLTTEENFKPGYKLRAACYNGNLTNASASRQTGFGPRTSTGDVVGVLADIQGETVTITFYFNKTCLGAGFKMPYHNCSLKPVVSLRQPKDKVSITSTTPPTETNRSELPLDFPEGSWCVKKFEGECVASDVTITFQKQPNGLGMTSKIVNTLRTSLDPGAGENTYKPSGRVVSTMMAGPEPLMKFEADFSNFMEGVTSIVSIKDACNNIVGCKIETSNGSVSECDVKPVSFEPVTEDIFTT